MGGVFSTIDAYERYKERKAEEQEEIKALWAQQDAEFAEEQKRKLEMVKKQKEAIKHVITMIYYATPVKTKLEKFPIGSPRAGKKYIWITMVRRAQQTLYRLLCFSLYHT